MVVKKIIVKTPLPMAVVWTRIIIVYYDPFNPTSRKNASFWPDDAKYRVKGADFLILGPKGLAGSHVSYE